jgi:signal peptidase II
MTRTWPLHAALIVSVACLVGCDHATKVAAEVALRDGPSVLVPGVVDLRYTENRDVAFNALARASLHPPAWSLAALAAGMTAAVFVAWARRRHAAWPEQVGFAFLAAGALGNALDRIVSGHVVDFIHVRFWPVFNVADVLVVAGIVVIALARGRAARAYEIGSRSVP